MCVGYQATVSRQAQSHGLCVALTQNLPVAAEVILLEADGETRFGLSFAEAVAAVVFESDVRGFGQRRRPARPLTKNG